MTARFNPDVCCVASDVEMCEIAQVSANVLKTIESDLTSGRRRREIESLIKPSLEC